MRVAGSLRRLVVPTTIALVAMLVGATPAPATDPIDEARQRLQQAQAAANATAVRYEETLRRRDEAAARVDELESSRAPLEARQTELRNQVAERAAVLYRNSTPTELLETLAQKGVAATAREAGLLRATAAADDRLVAELRNTTEELDAAETRPASCGLSSGTCSLASPPIARRSISKSSRPPTPSSAPKDSVSCESQGKNRSWEPPSSRPSN
jgi:hypothetical protein